MWNFERILNNHVDGVLVVDGTLRIVWANQALAELLGISRDEVVGKYCPELLHGTPEPVEGCPCLCAKGTSERRISEVVVPGRDVILESISDPVLDETGRFTGAVLVFRDITGRKARERRDALKSRRLELLSNIWSNLFTLGDIGLVLGEAARDMTSLLGVPRCAFVLFEGSGKTYEYRDPGVPFDGPSFAVHPCMQDPVGRFRETGGAVVIDDLGNDPRVSSREIAGGIVLVEGAFLGVPLRVLGKRVGVLSLDRPAPHRWTEFERETAEVVAQMAEVVISYLQNYREMKDLSTHFRHLIENIPGVVYRGYRDWTMHCYGPEVERLTGYPHEEFLDRSVRWTSCIHPEDVENVREAFRNAVRERRKILRTEYRILRKDGTVRWIADRRQFVYDNEGNFSHVDGLLLDITDSRREEEERRKLEVQFRQAQKMEAVGTLAGGIAHDFNNALTGILGYGELLRMRLGGDPKSSGELDEILRAAERAATLTRQLLTFARRQVVDPVNLDIRDVVKDLTGFFAKVAGAQIEIRTNPAADTPVVRADRGQVEQSVMNLFLNARDAMPGGGKLPVETGEVTLGPRDIREHPYMKEGRYALLAITDTGVGMDAETLERVFDPFFTTKGEGKGTGLGLAMVYGIVKQHEGYIHVYSEPGKGTTFRIYLPAIEGPADSRISVRTEPVKGGTERILLAEDEESIRSLAGRILTESGYTVYPARNGEEAVEQFRRHGEKISLAILDVVMPKMGGKDAYEEMRKGTPGLKVIFMSGYSGNAIHEKFVIHQGTPFLGKPFVSTVLLRKVREVLDG